MRWATGCGHAGETSPFGGRAKLPYNVDWAAKWDLFGVTIEPAGKDLSTKGGSRDRSDAVARELFGNEPPLNVPYEFLNIGGRKMSTSKGLGASATEIADVIPPEQLRTLFLRPKPKVAIEFDPDGTDAIPRLFDESDRLAAATAGREVRGELPPNHERLFALSLVEPDADAAAEAAAYRPAFSHLALLEQIPGVDVVERVTAEKGSELAPREERDPRGASRRRACVARGLRPGAGPARGPSRRRPRLRSTRWRPSSASTSAGLADALGEPGMVGRGGPGHDLLRRQGARAAGGQGLRRAVRGVPRPDSGPRAGWLLAALDRDVRRRAAARRGRRRGRTPMSVGVQRLRDDAEALRRGATDKGEDPTLVDRAIELDERRRAPRGRGGLAQGGAQRCEPTDRGGDPRVVPIRTAPRSAS